MGMVISEYNKPFSTKISIHTRMTPHTTMNKGKKTQFSMNLNWEIGMMMLESSHVSYWSSNKQRRK